MPTLRVVYEPEDEWHGELRAWVEANGFAGHGAAWFPRQALDEFCDSLSAYPLSADRPPHLQGGYWDREAAKLTDVHLSIRVDILSPTGRLALSVVVADRIGGGGGPPGSAHEAKTWFDIGYNDLSRFQAQLRKVLAGTVDEARLEPEFT